MLSDIVDIVLLLVESNSDEILHTFIECWVVHGRVVFPAESIAADLVAYCYCDM
jgi:hypothetical protein